MSLENKIFIGANIGTEMTETPYPGKEAVLAYLRKGSVFCASPGSDIDSTSGETIPGEKLVFESDRYYWGSDLVYYVETYNLRLPQEIEAYILESVA